MIYYATYTNASHGAYARRNIVGKQTSFIKYETTTLTSQPVFTDKYFVLLSVAMFWAGKYFKIITVNDTGQKCWPFQQRRNTREKFLCYKKERTRGHVQCCLYLKRYLNNNMFILIAISTCQTVAEATYETSIFHQNDYTLVPILVHGMNKI